VVLQKSAGARLGSSQASALRVHPVCPVDSLRNSIQDSGRFVQCAVAALTPTATPGTDAETDTDIDTDVG